MNTSRFIRGILAAVVLAAPLSMPSAHATPPPGHGGWQGTGTESPGIPATGCVSNLVTNMTGTAVLAGDRPVAVPVSFSGSSSECESAASGAGSGVLSGGLSGTVSYTRTGDTVTMVGDVAGTSSAAAFEMPRPTRIVCVRIRVSPPPWRVFIFVCFVVYL